MELETLLTKIKTLKEEVDAPDNQEYLIKQITESKLLEKAVEFVANGQDTTPLFQKFFETLEIEWIDEYERVGNGAEAVAIKNIDAVNKDNP